MSENPCKANVSQGLRVGDVLETINGITVNAPFAKP